MNPEYRDAPPRQAANDTPPPGPWDKDLSTSSYTLVVDGHAKADLAASDQALEAAMDLNERFAMLQLKVYDVERKRSEKVELAAA